MVWRRNRIGKPAWLAAGLAIMLLMVAGVSRAALIDAPHNETNLIVCGDCHTYSLWWQFPTPNSDLEAAGLRGSGVCSQCHRQGGRGPEKQGHDSVVMGDGHGVWSTSCIVCHDPHLQSQLAWVGSNEAELFLARGTLGATVIDNLDGTSSLAYSNATALPGWDYSTWGNKNTSVPSRGLILVVDRQAASNTYPVISASQTTPGNGLLIVKGVIAPASVNQSFGLIYGMLIKTQISAATVAAPGTAIAKTVKFFNPKTINNTGGFTDSSQPRQGICQVCHLATSHWTEDGNNEGHYSGQSCGTCHERRTGFMASGVDHSLVLLNSAQCASCHRDPVPLATHQARCALCHLSSTGGSALRPGLGAGTCTVCHPTYFDGHTHLHLIQESAVDRSWLAPGLACSYCHGGVDRVFSNFAEIKTIHLNACATCHGSVRGEVVSAIGGGGQPVHCLSCHSAKVSPATHGVNHASLVTATPSCVSCHNQSDLLLGIHATNRCLTCHSSTLAPVILVGSGVGHPGGGSCVTCHPSQGSDYKNHLVQDHNGFTMTGACTACHSGGSVVEIHKNACTDCHAVASGVLQGVAVNGAGDCRHCHPGLDTNNHLNDHKVMAFDTVPAGLVCGSCHTENFNPSSGHLGKSGATGTITCATCHGSSDPNIQTAIATGQAGGTVHCQDCHGGTRAVDHPAGGHESKGYVVAVGSCCTCHRGAEVVQDLHRNNCGSCHTAQLTMKAGITAGDCVHCHFNFWGHAKIATHAGQVDATPACLVCHPGPENVNDTHKGSCGSCHDMAGGGILVGKAALYGPGTCTNCHRTYGGTTHQYKDHQAAGYLQPVGSCVSCHSGPEVVVNTHQNNCSSCHSANLGLLAGVTIGDCLHCHSDFWGHKTITDHSGQVIVDPACSSCHPGADTVLNVHAGQCGLCHDLTAGGVLIGKAALHGPGTCSNCHTDRVNFHQPDHDLTAYDSLPAGLNCGGCHPEKSNVNTGHIGRSGTSGVISCDSCHGGSYATVITTGKAGFTVYCLDCHGQRPANHPLDLMVDHNTLILATASCVTCHREAERGIGIHASAGCYTCHDANTFALTGSAVGHPGASSCAVCHASWAEDYRNHQPADHAILLTVPECLTCHPSTDIVDTVHEGRCSHCHVPGSGVLVNSGVTGPAVACVYCHPTVTTTLPHVADHDVAFFDNAPVLPCVNCHQANIVDEHLGKTGKSGVITCASCHTGIFYPYQGVIDLGKAGIGVYCEDCHGYRSPNHPN